MRVRVCACASVCASPCVRAYVCGCACTRVQWNCLISSPLVCVCASADDGVATAVGLLCGVAGWGLVVMATYLRRLRHKSEKKSKRKRHQVMKVRIPCVPVSVCVCSFPVYVPSLPPPVCVCVRPAVG